MYTTPVSLYCSERLTKKKKGCRTPFRSPDASPASDSLSTTISTPGIELVLHVSGTTAPERHEFDRAILWVDQILGADPASEEKALQWLIEEMGFRLRSDRDLKNALWTGAVRLWQAIRPCARYYDEVAPYILACYLITVKFFIDDWDEYFEWASLPMVPVPIEMEAFMLVEGAIFPLMMGEASTP